MRYLLRLIVSCLVWQRKEIIVYKWKHFNEKYHKELTQKIHENPSNGNEIKNEEKQQNESETFLNFSEIISTEEFVKFIPIPLDLRVGTEKNFWLMLYIV